MGIGEDKKLSLEFFFYTNSAEKATNLARDLEALKYSVTTENSVSDKKLFLVTGWTTKMEMSEPIVMDWTTKMTEMGYKCDCEFDGWGTSPDQ